MPRARVGRDELLSAMPFTVRPLPHPSVFANLRRKRVGVTSDKGLGSELAALCHLFTFTVVGPWSSISFPLSVRKYRLVVQILVWYTPRYTLFPLFPLFGSAPVYRGSCLSDIPLFPSGRTRRWVRCSLQIARRPTSFRRLQSNSHA